MTRKSLRPQLNQIRGWVNQGRTDAWIAHQLEVTVQQIETFKRQHNLNPDGDTAAPAIDEVDLRAEDDAAIADELEIAEREAEKRRVEEAKKEEERLKAKAAQEEADAKAPSEEKRPRRSRGTRSRRRGATKSFEGTFDHGEEGYGLWLDPSIEDSPIYAEYWAGHRSVEVTIEEDQIVIRRVGGDSDDGDE